MTKITIEKDEEIADVIDKVTEEAENEITLVIPKGSVLARSVKNFNLLRREAEGAGKSVVIESVDDAILAFAKQSGLEGSHPLWGGVRAAGGLTDIVPVGSEEHETGKKPARRGKKKAAAEPVKLTVHEEPEESEKQEEKGEPEEKETSGEDEESAGKETAAAETHAFEEAGERFFKKRSIPEIMAGEGGEEEEETPRRMPRKFIGWIAGVVVLILVVLGVMTWVFGHVTIAIDFQKTPWTYQNNFIADKSISEINPATSVIPAQLFNTQKNTTQLFPATGNANVSVKAQGTVTIYNAYSSAKQDLVATTRFVTPDGKLFRLVSSVTVPGATITNGQIVPSSIDTTVIADQPGTSYNVGPVAKLTIPGFQGTPKYAAFYGQLKTGTSGGFVGNKAVPTASDITNAKNAMTSVLESSLTNGLTSIYPNNFKILDGATSVQVTKLTVNTSTDASGNFSVFGEASLQALGFDETALKAYLLSLAQSQEVAQVASSTFSAPPTLNYSNVKADFTKGIVSFTLSATGTLESKFDAGTFKASIAGKSLNDARSAIAAIPGLADGKISAWPMWLWSIPSNTGKISVSAH